jgi:hypothetical protein
LQLTGLLVIILILEFIICILTSAHVEGHLMHGTIDDCEWIIGLSNLESSK